MIMILFIFVFSPERPRPSFVQSTKRTITHFKCIFLALTQLLITQMYLRILFLCVGICVWADSAELDAIPFDPHPMGTYEIHSNHG